MKDQKIAVINFSGNVGKSMVCDTLLKPRIKDVETIKIETINSDGSLDAKVSAKDIKTVFEKIDLADSAIIDVGSSNIEAFMENLEKLYDAHEDIDFFLIPTTPKTKQQVDTITTIESLMDIGVEIERIKLVFNFADPDYSIQQQYPVIFESDLRKPLGLDDQKNIFVIEENPVFDLLGEMAVSFVDVVNDERDFKALIKKEKDTEKKKRLSHQRSTQRLAKKFEQDLDLTFEQIKAACSEETPEEA